MSDIIEISSKKKSEKLDLVFNRKAKECYHGLYMVDESLNKVTCGKCNKELNPIWVLNELAHKNSKNRHRLMDLKMELKKTEDKMHCKCDKCGKMTRIAR